MFLEFSVSSNSMLFYFVCVRSLMAFSTGCEKWHFITQSLLYVMQYKKHDFDLVLGQKIFFKNLRHFKKILFDPCSSSPRLRLRTIFDFVAVTAREECKYTSATQAFFMRNTLETSTSLNEPGHIVWWLAVCLLVAWILVFLGMFKGITSSGKVIRVYYLNLKSHMPGI